MTFERVFSVWDYYDGILTGVANFHGTAHYFDKDWSEEQGDYLPTFTLIPITEAELAEVVKRESIFRAWEARFHRGEVDESTHPGAAGGSASNAELQGAIKARGAGARTSLRHSIPEFSSVPLQPPRPKGAMAVFQVKWHDAPSAAPGSPQMNIRLDDLRGPEIRALLEEHLRNMHEISPPESVHALDLDALRHPSITFWTAWSGAELLGCGALKELDRTHGEVKSMRTAAAHRRTGIAGEILQRILTEARSRCYLRLSLETGSQVEFLPARRLYERHGFSYCEPFSGYTADPNSVFMTLQLRP